MTQPRKPVRAFTGLVGLSPEPVTVQKRRYCPTHGQEEPCVVCERNARDRVVRDLLQQRWAEVANKVVEGTPKCVHGHMYALDYCDVCRLGPVDPHYNPHEHEATISAAMKKAKTALRYASGAFFSAAALDEGKRDWQDLRQLVDLEIWLAKKKYREKWNDALCFTIAKNTASAYLGERIKHDYVLIEDADGKPVLDEFGQQKRIPRFVRFDMTLTDENGDLSDVSAPEIEIAQKEIQQALAAPDTDWSVIAEHLPGLREYAKNMKPTQRAVAEAMLQPGFNVRGVPGVPKSTVARVRPVVVKALRWYLQHAGSIQITK